MFKCWQKDLRIYLYTYKDIMVKGYLSLGERVLNNTKDLYSRKDLPTLNNISVILWWSVLMVEETGIQGDNHRTCRN